MLSLPACSSGGPSAAALEGDPHAPKPQQYQFQHCSADSQTPENADKWEGRGGQEREWEGRGDERRGGGKGRGEEGEEEGMGEERRGEGRERGGEDRGRVRRGREGARHAETPHKLSRQ